MPLVVGRDLLGVVYLECAEPYAFAGPVESLLRIAGAHAAAALAARGASGTRQAPAVVAAGAGPVMELVRYRADDTVLCESAYLVKGSLGRILWSILAAHARTGRTTFTNRELRLDPELDLPVGNDNLESRLLALRRRLDAAACGIALRRTGRGLLELRVDGPVELTVVPAVSRARR